MIRLIRLLILMGHRDRLVPNIGRELEKPRVIFVNHPAHIETIPNAGHIFVPSTAIMLTNKKIDAFLE
jgi:hypothetical protein